MDEPVEEFVGENEEVENQQCADCAYGNYPDFSLEPDKEQMELGTKESSYILGFLGGFGVLGLSEGSLMQILQMKISLGYQKELLRMQLASEERKASIYAKMPNTYIDTDE
ncbi:MAG TPA: hypothetical protein DDX37_02630 [Candidatus Omnitrophica bacterium]|nr:hypothetical protein [Candidatus Omnitrophota bacterium]